MNGNYNLKIMTEIRIIIEIKETEIEETDLEIHNSMVEIGQLKIIDKDTKVKNIIMIDNKLISIILETITEIENNQEEDQMKEIIEMITDHIIIITMEDTEEMTINLTLIEITIITIIAITKEEIMTPEVEITHVLEVKVSQETSLLDKENKESLMKLTLNGPKLVN
jgi:hypothetical protein